MQINDDYRTQIIKPRLRDKPAPRDRRMEKRDLIRERRAGVPAILPTRDRGREDFERKMTIAIAAVSSPDGHIVTVSDMMVSNGDLIQAADKGAMKTRSIAKSWGLLFSGAVSQFLPIVRRAQAGLDAKGVYELGFVKEVVAQAYRDVFEAEFTARYLSRYSYQSLQEFRLDGLDQFGSKFNALCAEVDHFKLGVFLLGYGFGSNGTAHLFEVHDPGVVIDHDMTDYAVTGSGDLMALASLRRRPLGSGLDATIYRALEAKFSAESATGVGRETFVLTMNKDGRCGLMTMGHVEKIRAIWESTLRVPDPKDALDLIKTTGAFRAMTA